MNNRTMVLVTALMITALMPMGIGTVTGETWMSTVTVTEVDSNSDTFKDTADIEIFVEQDNWWSGPSYIKVTAWLYPPGVDWTTHPGDHVDSDTYTDNAPGLDDHTYELSLTVPKDVAPGVFTIVVQEDNDDDDGDNIHLTEKTANLYPIEVKSEFSMSVDAASKIADLGERASYTFTIENTAIIDDTYTLTIPIPPQGWDAKSDKQSVNVASKSIADFTISIDAPSSYDEGDDKQITLAIEATAKDGKTKKTISITAIIGLCDLTIKEGSHFSFSDSNPMVGDKVMIKTTVTNEGTITAEDVSVEIFLEGDPIYSATIDNITAGGNADVLYEWTAVQGSLDLEVIVDEGKKIKEFLEDNNNWTKSITVRAPDLTLSETNIEVKPDKINEGDDVTFAITLKNTGTADAKDFSYEIFIDGKSIGVFDCNSTVAKNSGEKTVTETWTATAGSHEVKVVIDGDELLAEVNDDNNEAKTDFAVNTPPIPKLNFKNETIKINSEFTIDAGGSTDGDGTIAEYYFDFGDGQNSGWVSTKSVSHTYTTTGTYTVKLTVKDDTGAESNLQATGTVIVEKKASSGGSTPGFELVGLVIALLVVIGFRKGMA